MEPLFVLSDGIRWVRPPGSHNYTTGWPARPECPEHRVELVAQTPGGRTRPLGPSGEQQHVDEPVNVPYCEAGAHRLALPASTSFEEAERVAKRLLDAEAKRRREHLDS